MTMCFFSRLFVLLTRAANLDRLFVGSLGSLLSAVVPIDWTGKVGQRNRHVPQPILDEELSAMLLTLDSSLHKPLYVQIRDQIRERILEGGLKIGERLEPSRGLAKRLGVHRTTVGNAYAELEAEGLIQGTVGRGTFVSPLASQLKDPSPRARRSTSDFFWDGIFVEEPRDDALG